MINTVLLLSCDVCEAEIITIVRKELTCLLAFCLIITPQFKIIVSETKIAKKYLKKIM